jgi:uncharacterized membrane protein YukC
MLSSKLNISDHQKSNSTEKRTKTFFFQNSITKLEESVQNDLLLKQIPYLLDKWLIS